MDLKFFPSQLFTHTGSKKAELFKGFALAKLRAVVEEASFGNLYQHKREFVLIPGFTITAGVIGNKQFAHVHLEDVVADAAEKLFMPQELKFRKFQNITVAAVNWTAGAGNPSFPRSEFLIGDSAEITVTSGLSGNPVTVTKVAGTSLFTLSAVTKLAFNSWKVTLTVTGEGLFGLSFNQAGNSDYLAAQTLTLTWNSDDVVPVINIAKIHQPYTMPYLGTVAYEVGKLEYEATAKRGGALTWSVVSFDPTLLAIAYFAETADNPPKPFLHVAFNSNCQYGLTYVEIKVTETLNGVSKDSDSVIVLIERSAYSTPSFTASGTALTYSGGVRPYRWQLGGVSVYNVSLTGGVGGYPVIVNGQLTDTFTNNLSITAGACQTDGYVKVTDACDRESIIPLSAFGIPTCTPAPPLSVTVINDHTLHVSGGTPYSVGNKYIGEFWPAHSTGGVSIWTPDGGTTMVMSTNGCFCAGSGIKVSDAGGSSVITAFVLGVFGPVVKCTTGCGGVSGGGGGGGGSGTWLTVYDGVANGNGPWICAPIGSGFEGCASYTSRSNDGKFTLTWGYGDAASDNYGWMTMLAGFNAWCVANNRQADYVELTEADFGLVESFKLVNGVGYHCAALQMLG